MSRIVSAIERTPVEPEKRRAFRAVDIAQALLNQDGLCANCGDPIAWFEADHVLPRDLLGKTDLDNLQLLCKPCHLIKSAQDIKRISKARRLRKTKTPAKRTIIAKPFQTKLTRGFDGKVKDRK